MDWNTIISALKIMPPGDILAVLVVYLFLRNWGKKNNGCTNTDRSESRDDRSEKAQDRRDNVVTRDLCIEKHRGVERALDTLTDAQHEFNKIQENIFKEINDLKKTFMNYFMDKKK